MKTLKISLISFTFLFAAITVASARQNSLLDKAKKAKAAKAASTSKTSTKGGDKKKDVGMAVKGQGASNTQSTKSNSGTTAATPEPTKK
jgi:hypothetical protein